MTELFTVDQQTDDNKNYLVELVGEGKKFKSPEDLAKGKFHADQTIETMTKRFDELREDYLKVVEENKLKARLEDLIDKASNRQVPNSDTTANSEKPSLDPKQIEDMLEIKLQQREVASKRNANLTSVEGKLKEEFGDKYIELVENRRKELGLSKEDVKDLAAKSPAAFLRTMGLDQQPRQDNFQAPRSNQRTDSFAPTGAKDRTWEYYMEMKKADPMSWYDPKIAVQMQEDAIRLGAKFKDGDYFKKRLHEQDIY